MNCPPFFVYGSKRDFLLLDHAALFDTGFLACQATQIVKFRTAHFTVFVHCDRVDERRLNGENTLNTDVVAHFAHGETLFVAFAGDADNHTAILLDTLLVSFFDTVGYCDGVAGSEFNLVGACGKCFFGNFDQIHFFFSIKC